MSCKEDMIKHIKRAIEIEELGYQKYKEFANKTNNQHAKLLFQRLMDQEMDHQKFFSDLLNNVETDTELKNEKFCSALVPMDPKEIFKKDDETSDTSENYISALDYSADAEEKTYKYFLEVSESESNETMKKVFKIMADYELEHLNIIKSELEYAKNIPST